MRIGNKEFSDKTHIMGILNVTPDSFSDGNRFYGVDKALYQAERMILDGADIIDVGGESTRPGYTKISDEEEIERVVPIIEEIKKNFDIPVSIDTYKSKVCKNAAIAGADMINDIWGFKYDEKIAKVASEYDMAACLMHNRNIAEYKNLTNDVISDLSKSIEIAKKAGVERIIVDPGVGFAKSYEENIEIIKNVKELKRLGYPVLLGVSRKSVIGITLGEDVENRLEGTIALSVWAAIEGCSFIRVHDVKENRRAVAMIERVMER